MMSKLPSRDSCLRVLLIFLLVISDSLFFFDGSFISNRKPDRCDWSKKHLITVGYAYLARFLHKFSFHHNRVVPPLSTAEHIIGLDVCCSYLFITSLAPVAQQTFQFAPTPTREPCEQKERSTRRPRLVRSVILGAGG